jgi:hypothetical protein
MPKENNVFIPHYKPSGLPNALVFPQKRELELYPFLFLIERK